LLHTGGKLWPALAQVKPNNKHRELYLTDAIAVLNAKGETVLAAKWRPIRAKCWDAIRARIWPKSTAYSGSGNAPLMDDGVTIQLPETVLIDPDVTAGKTPSSNPAFSCLGKTKIGARCTIRRAAS